MISRDTNSVSVISTQTASSLKSISVGIHPSHVVADQLRREIYVANELSNSLSIINATMDMVVDTVAVGSRPAGVVVGEGDVYVLNNGANTISLVSKSSRKVTSTIVLSGSPNRGLLGDFDMFFVTDSSDGAVIFINDSNVVTATVNVGKGPVGLGIDQYRNHLYVTNRGSNTVSVLDTIGERMLKDITVGSAPYGVITTGHLI